MATLLFNAPQLRTILRVQSLPLKIGLFLDLCLCFIGVLAAQSRHLVSFFLPLPPCLQLLVVIGRPYVIGRKVLVGRRFIIGRQFLARRQLLIRVQFACSRSAVLSRNYSPPIDRLEMGRISGVELQCSMA